MGLTLWQEILWGWVVMTIAPKLVIIPIWRWMWLALEDTRRQDEIDAAWLASLEDSGSGPDGRRRKRPRQPWSRGPRRGPGGSGGAAARVAPRPPSRCEARARRLPRPTPSR